MHDQQPAPLERRVGLFGATMMGLGSILGTGVFVSIGIAAGVAGAGVVLAIAIAAVVATCNALSSAQLAASHPVSGGAYEYGFRYLRPSLGFAAGWMFLCAKSASAATAALGFTGYLLSASGQDATWLVPISLAVVAVLTAIVLAGIHQSSRVNIVIVSLTLVSLLAFCLAGVPEVSLENLKFSTPPTSLLHASALMFVAFTGYGRIATLGEEVIDPRRTIPKAIVTTLTISALLYLAVAAVAIGAAGAGALAAATTADAAPLEVIARTFAMPVHPLVSIGAMTAMLGVLLNLILGLSRVVLAMARRGDMPRVLTDLRLAIVVVGLLIASLAAIGRIETTWTFSALTVLLYYSVTNFAALRLGGEDQLYSRWWSWGGLVACLGLALAVDSTTWWPTIGVLMLGLAWHALRRRQAA